jgi:hypothetical protein
MSDKLKAPERLKVVMGTAGIRLWSHDRELPEWAKDDEQVEYVRADAREAIRDIQAMRCRLMAQQQTALAASLTAPAQSALRKHFLESAEAFLDAAKELSNVR